MKSSPAGTRLRVAIFVDMLSDYGRGILVGMSSYVRAHASWSIFGDPERVAAPVAQLADWRGDGIIAQLYQPELIRAVRRTRIPVVNVSEYLPGVDLPAALPDNVAVGRLAAEHFLERGYESFGYCGFAGHHYSEVRRRSFAATIEATGRQCESFESPPPQEQPEAWESRRGELADWLSALAKPAAVLGCNDARARHVADACERAGLRVPEDVAILGVDNDELVCELSNPPLSSIDVSSEQVGYEAAAVLDRLMRGEPPPPRPIRVPPVGVVTRRSSDALAIADADVSAAIRFIHDHSREPITVDEVVSATTTSRRVLERRFRNLLGRTIGEELAAARLARAKQLLIHTDLPTPDVAARCGFNYVQQFNALFRRQVGITPTAFRRQYRKR